MGKRYKGPTQREMVLDFIIKHGSITQHDGDRMGIKRVAARVYDLKRENHPLVMNMDKGKNQRGQTVHFARYSLQK